MGGGGTREEEGEEEPVGGAGVTQMCITMSQHRPATGVGPSSHVGRRGRRERGSVTFKENIYYVTSEKKEQGDMETGKGKRMEKWDGD